MLAESTWASVIYLSNTSSMLTAEEGFDSRNIHRIIRTPSPLFKRFSPGVVVGKTFETGRILQSPSLKLVPITALLMRYSLWALRYCYACSCRSQRIIRRANGICSQCIQTMDMMVHRSCLWQTLLELSKRSVDVHLSRL